MTFFLSFSLLNHDGSTQVHVIMMRLLSIMMSKSQAQVDASSKAESVDGEASDRNTYSNIASLTATILTQEKVVDFCFNVLRYTFDHNRPRHLLFNLWPLFQRLIQWTLEGSSRAAKGEGKSVSERHFAASQSQQCLGRHVSLLLASIRAESRRRFIRALSPAHHWNGFESHLPSS